MKNVTSVTEFIKEKYLSMLVDPDRKVLEFLKSENGESCYYDDDNYYRCYKFVDRSVTYELPDSNELLENLGYAIGNFHYMLSDFNTKQLNETIPDFHNTEKRLSDLYVAVEKDPFGRAQKAMDDVLKFRKNESEILKLSSLDLPSRVVHNDPKCNNVLFDEQSNEILALIDLDTVMPGLAAHDFGDAVRSACNSCKEDEKDYSLVSLDLDKFKAFTKGYIKKAGGFLSEKEKNSLALGVYTLACELSARFLTDYILGDVYFAKDYGMHNLVRARSQLAFAEDVYKKLPEMNRIVSEICM